MSPQWEHVCFQKTFMLIIEEYVPKKLHCNCEKYNSNYMHISVLNVDVFFRCSFFGFEHCGLAYDI